MLMILSIICSRFRLNRLLSSRIVVMMNSGMVIRCRIRLVGLWWLVV